MPGPLDPREVDAFTARARAAFEESVERLDGATRSRLNQARQHALAVAERRHAPLLRILAPAGGLGAAVAIAVLLLRPQAPTPETALEPRAVLDDIEIVVAEESFEMLEDMEFYAWLQQDLG